MLRDAFRPLRYYGRFRGRASRREFWGFQLLALIFGAAVEAAARSAGLPFLSVLAWLYLLLPSLAVGVQRLHDTDRRGWWQLLPWSALILLLATALVLGNEVDSGSTVGHILIGMILTASVALVAAVLLLFAWFSGAGNVGPNRFGPDPIGTNIGAIFD